MTNWQNKVKVQHSIDEGEILTPDGQQILVGEDEDQVLLYQVAFNNWNNKARINQPSWSVKTKVEQ